MIKQIKKVGGSYLIVLPKNMVEFYDWNNKVVSIDINSERILITKTDIQIKPAEEVEIKTKKGWKKVKA